MLPNLRNPIFTSALGVLLTLAAASAYGQGHGRSGGGFGGTFPNSHTTPLSPPSSFRGDAPSLTPRIGGNTSTHSGFQVGPPGRWWDDRDFAKSLNLQSDQKKRMDGIFNDHKGELSSLLKGLRKEENTLGSLSRAKEPDEQQILTQIDRVAQARADLEKSAARMLLSIRRELTPDQVKKLADDQDTQIAPQPTE